jgi:hypothetical protein
VRLARPLPVRVIVKVSLKPGRLPFFALPALMLVRVTALDNEFPFFDFFVEFGALVIPRSKLVKLPALTELGFRKAEKPFAFLSVEEKEKPEIPSTSVGTLRAIPVMEPFFVGAPVVFNTLTWSVAVVSFVATYNSFTSAVTPVPPIPDVDRVAACATPNPRRSPAPARTPATLFKFLKNRIEKPPRFAI